MFARCMAEVGEHRHPKRRTPERIRHVVRYLSRWQFRVGRTAYRKGRYEKAIRLLRVRLRLVPDDRMARLYIARAERELGRADLSLATISDALARDPNWPPAIRHAVHVQLRLGREEVVRRTVEEIEDLTPYSDDDLSSIWHLVKSAAPRGATRLADELLARRPADRTRQMWAEESRARANAEEAIAARRCYSERGRPSLAIAGRHHGRATPVDGAAASGSAEPPSREKLRFARGFTLTQESGRAPHANWIERNICGWVLAHDPRVSFRQATVGHASVSVLGMVIDTATWADEDAAVARAAEALDRSEDAFLDVTDCWAGRYLIVWRKNGRVSVMTDATGMRTCFFTMEGPLQLASHCQVAARLAGLPRADLAFRRESRRRVIRAWYLPGRVTPWAGVVFLTPNIALDLGNRALRRVWPRRQLAQRSLDDATSRLAENLTGQMHWLTRSGRPIVVSLSGGLDSRTTLAASRFVASQFTFFTYRSKADLRIASRIADTVGLRHIEVAIPPKLQPEDEIVRRNVLANSPLIHYPKAAVMYRRLFPSDALHVRSNVAGVGRQFFHEKGTDNKLKGPEDMAAVWRRMQDVPECVAAFEEWAKAVKFWDVSEVDRLDLFLWEHRLPCFQGCVLLESDVAFDTHTPFNCRTVLENMLSVPAYARREGVVFKLLIDGAWPEISGFPLR